MTKDSWFYIKFKTTEEQGLRYSSGQYYVPPQLVGNSIVFSKFIATGSDALGNEENLKRFKEILDKKFKDKDINGLFETLLSFNVTLHVCDITEFGSIRGLGEYEQRIIINPKVCSIMSEIALVTEDDLKFSLLDKRFVAQPQ